MTITEAPAAPLADLELALRQISDGYSAEIRFTPAGSSAPVRLLTGDPPIVRLDEAARRALREQINDPEQYAATLSSMVYADTRLREALAQALAVSAGSGSALRLRLVLDERDPELHSLFWESLHDPTGRGPMLGANERVRFSRFLSSTDLEPLRPRPLERMNALLVVCNGADLDAYQLTPLDVDAEIARAQAALGDMPTTVVSSAPEQPVTLNRLIEALRTGPDILYLIAHGTLHRGQPYLWLDADDGLSMRINASLLVSQIQALEQRPLLIILGSCQSAGNRAVEGTLNALGPQLAAAGIGAVLAQQGDLLFSTAALMLPVFLRELRRDGQVDRAAAAARAALMSEKTWWQPVLWLRVLDGQLWRPDAPKPHAAPALPPHNLPTELDQLLGRDHDLSALRSLLDEPMNRLLTLVGPGGVGKTRLALALAWQVLPRYPNGVWFIALTDLRDPALLLTSIAQTVGVAEQAGQTLNELLQIRLRSKQRTLLILDTFEQIHAAAPQLIPLLSAAPDLEIMVTSRMALRLSGEQEYPVLPFPLPTSPRVAHAPSTRLAELAAHPAIALFVRRATAVRPNFGLNEQNMDAVAQIVNQLDGLPLAIELAAARSRLLSPQAMLGRLDDRLSFLTGGARDRADHHQTLQATIAWSYELLSQPEQRLFERLAVFAGGCTLEAAEAICDPLSDLEIDLFDGLQSLVEESLLLTEEQADGSLKFRMLTTIRAFALERFAEQAQAAHIWQQFISYYAAFVQTNDREARGPKPEAALDQFERDHVNLRAALRWTLDHAAWTTAGDISIGLWWFWYVRGHATEGRTWLAEMLSHAEALPPLQQAELHLGAGNLAQAQADYRAATDHFTVALSRYEQANAMAGVTRTLNSLGITALRQGAYLQAQQYYERSLHLCRELGLQTGVITLLTNLGIVAMALNDFDAAQRSYAESLSLARATQDRTRQALALNNLSWVAVMQRDTQQAEQWLAEAMPLCRSIGDQSLLASALLASGLAALFQDQLAEATTAFHESLRLNYALHNRGGVAYGLDGCALVAAQQGKAQRAARLWSAAEAMRRVIGAHVPPSEQAVLAYNREATLATLAPSDLAAAQAAGAALSVDEAVRDALGDA